MGIFEGGEAANCLIWGGEAAKVVRRRRKKRFRVFLKVFETDNLFSKPTTYTRLYTPWEYEYGQGEWCVETIAGGFGLSHGPPTLLGWETQRIIRGTRGTTLARAGMIATIEFP